MTKLEKLYDKVAKCKRLFRGDAYILYLGLFFLPTFLAPVLIISELRSFSCT